MIRRFRRVLSVWSIVNRRLGVGCLLSVYGSHQVSQIDFWSQAMTPRVGRMQRKCDIVHWNTVSSVMSLAAPRARRVTDSCVRASNPRMVTLAPQSWYVVPFTVVGGVNGWCWMEPSTSNTTPVALTLFSVILQVAEPIRDWSPILISNAEVTHIKLFLNNWILLNLSEFRLRTPKGNLRRSVYVWFHQCCR